VEKAYEKILNKMNDKAAIGDINKEISRALPVIDDLKGSLPFNLSLEGGEGEEEGGEGKDGPSVDSVHHGRSVGLKPPECECSICFFCQQDLSAREEDYLQARDFAASVLLTKEISDGGKKGSMKTIDEGISKIDTASTAALGHLNKVSLELDTFLRDRRSTSLEAKSLLQYIKYVKKRDAELNKLTAADTRPHFRAASERDREGCGRDRGLVRATEAGKGGGVRDESDESVTGMEKGGAGNTEGAEQFQTQDQEKALVLLGSLSPPKSARPSSKSKSPRKSARPPLVRSKTTL
jgi:hypothetical protein